MKTMFNTGELWNKLLWYKQKNYLIGCGSPNGSDSDTSATGIVQGHAYSILDITTIDGHKLIQLRNPWGSGAEWNGDWSDSSSMWNEKRKVEAYKRMKDQVGRVEEIGKVGDGVFWMSFSDWYLNFQTLYLCRFFDKDWTEIFFESEWSK